MCGNCIRTAARNGKFPVRFGTTAIGSTTSPMDCAGPYSGTVSALSILGWGNEMILGMTPFTLFHVLISLVGILSGLVVLYGMLQSRRLPGWTALFLITTVATSVTGFFFPFVRFLPSHGVGVLSLIVLAFVVPALYRFHLAGRWRAIYVIGAVLALYLNVFVLVVQLFAKVPALHALAPTQKEPPFAITQGVVLLLFIVLGILAVKRFRPDRMVAGR
jgi:hypothetical protein